MSEQQLTPKEVFVEIGPGLAPAAVSGSRSFNDGRMYVGIDSAEGDYMSTAEGDYGRQVQNQLATLATRMTVERPNEHITFLEGDGKQLPLPDGSAKEVYIANVLTAPQRLSYRRRLLSEASRILQDDGEAVVKVTWDAWMWPKDEVTGWIENAGLKVSLVAEAGTKAYAELEDIYGVSQEQSSESYYIVAGKREDSTK